MNQRNNVNTGKKGVVNMAVMAKPNQQSFVVSEKNREKFEMEKTSKLEWLNIMQSAKDFDTYNLKIENAGEQDKS